MFLVLLDPHRDPLVRGTDPRIRIRIGIRTKISWNTEINVHLLPPKKDLQDYVYI
jgi:hypothetical protein